MPEPKIFSPKPVSYILRSTTILRFLNNDRYTAREVSEATTLPLTTVIRTAAEMKHGNVLNARVIGGELWLTVRHRHHP